MLTSHDLAARFIPLAQEDRAKVLKRLPRRKGERSQLFDSFDGTWYVHHGPLILGEDFDNTLNLAVDGDLTVRGTLDDDAGTAHLVVLGDLRCRHLLSRHLLVITGSLYCGGLCYADYNDHAFEIWGEVLGARALVLADKSARLAGERSLEYFYDDDQREAQNGDPDILIPRALRYLDEDGTDVEEEDRRSGATVTRVAPADFDDLRKVARRDPEIFTRPLDFGRVETRTTLRLALLQTNCPASLMHRASEDPDLHADLALSPAATPAHLEALAGSLDKAILIAVGSHPLTPVETLVGLAKHRSGAVRGSVAHHPGLPEAALRTLARDRLAGVRQQVAASRSASAFLHDLARDRSAEVRRAVASHPHLADDDRMLLLRDVDQGVKRRALRYLPASLEWARRLLETDDPDLVAWAIERRVRTGGVGTFAEGAEGLFDPRRAIREAWLGQLAQAPEAMRFFDLNASRFIDDESPLIRRFLAGCARGRDALSRLAHDNDSSVRRAALDNLQVPGNVLIEETEQLCAAPAQTWSIHDPGYLDHILAVQALLKHPRLPAEAVSRIHAVYPMAYRLEPHRNMRLKVILERAQSLSASLAFEAEFQQWQSAAEDTARSGTIFAALLNSEDSYLQAAARMNAETPLDALLRHSRQAHGASLEDVAVNPALGARTTVAATLLHFLTSQDGDAIAVALAGNPDLPLRVLRDVAQMGPTASERARVTAWLAHGELL